ncbi:FHA domain-containing protein [Candidatus Villigracilis affinis]|uniref:FHA domain-containing protein n=1 Tax=Candidatus Villigracilis affinis TaxID=3140682 RepID=UPI002A224241|nr:FHA domain-containing protein [Anaerolineales bacterium]
MAAGSSTKGVMTIHVPSQPARQVELTRTSYNIGRQEDNDIVIAAEVVSRQHALLEFNSLDWIITDLQSKNGTYINGSKVDKFTLSDGISLQMGRNPKTAITITFQLAPQSAISASPSAMDTAIEPREPTTGLVKMRSLPSSNKNHQIIGRDPEADINLPSPSVSRRHAALQASQPEWQLVDLNSKNGTFLNGKRITNPQKLRAGDIIQIASYRLIYEGQGKVTPFAAEGLRLDGLHLTWDAPSAITWDDIKNLNLNVLFNGKKKRILEDVNISCYPREFIALVGGSGAGKSTVMKALSGILREHTGKVKVEGDDLYENYDAYRAMIGYVPQDDILHMDLTVVQALRYSAQMRLPTDISSAEIEKRIDNVLKQVELQGQKTTQIKKLSGGQRKRASIAVELLADPPLFFLDEPTSGLDPGLEQKMMKMLRGLADSGKTIILVTHATANITECHQVAFLSQGRLVYYGPPHQAGDFFEVGNDNFAGIYREISDSEPAIAVEKAILWERRFRMSSFYKKYVTDRIQTGASIKNTNTQQRNSKKWFTPIESIYQFAILFARYTNLVFRDRTLRTILLFLMPVLALLILGIAEPNWLTGDSAEVINQQLNSDIAAGEQSASYLVVGSSQKLLFIMALTAVMLGLFSSAYELVKERNIFGREKMVFLRLVPYLASKIALLSAFAALQCALFLAVIGWNVKFPSFGVFLPISLEMYITLLLGVITAICLGLLISAIASNENTVTYIIMGLLFIQITFAGVIFDLPGAAKSLSSITLTRWTMEGLGTTANLAHLDTLSQTRIQPDPVTQEVSVEVDKPAPGWEPVTVSTEMKQVDGCVNPIPMLSVIENELVEVKETVTESVTVEPDPVDIITPYGFTINYDRTTSHLFSTWAMLGILSLVFFSGTVAALKIKNPT